jgi:hypothetical protein
MAHVEGGFLHPNGILPLPDAIIIIMRLGWGIFRVIAESYRVLRSSNTPNTERIAISSAPVEISGIRSLLSELRRPDSSMYYLSSG